MAVDQNQSTQRARLQTVPLVFFDGDCGLCSRSVLFFLRIDRRNRLFFSPLQGFTASRLLGSTNAFTSHLGTVIFSSGRRITKRSTAVADILCHLHGIWPWIGASLALIPRPLRDGGYMLIARLRKHLVNTCQLGPQPRLLP